MRAAAQKIQSPTPQDLQPAEPHRVPADVPQFKSFAHIKDPRVRRAKEYETVLQFALANCPPEFTARMEKEIAWARSEQERSKPSDRDRIFLSITSVELGRQEIADDLDLPVSTVYKHLQELISYGLVYTRNLPARGDTGGRPLVVYGQTHTAP